MLRICSSSSPSSLQGFGFFYEWGVEVSGQNFGIFSNLSLLRRIFHVVQLLDCSHLFVFKIQLYQFYFMSKIFYFLVVVCIYRRYFVLVYIPFLTPKKCRNILSAAQSESLRSARPYFHILRSMISSPRRIFSYSL